jgi:hypothetical protein
MPTLQPPLHSQTTATAHPATGRWRCCDAVAGAYQVVQLLSTGRGLGDRPRFMALWGLLLGSFLLALIALQAVPSFVVPACE